MVTSHRQKIHLALLAILLFATVFVWFVLLHNKNELVVAFLDVGQGDSILIQAPNGNQILIDGGPDKKVLREIGKVMPFYDRSIDVVIATHPDKDHIGGLPDVFKRYDIKTFIEPGVEHDTGTYESLLKAIETEKSKHIIAKQKMTISLGGGIVLQVLFPNTNASGLESNTASIVARLVYGESEFMLTGDSPKSIENYLVSTYGTQLQSDVLKAGHHGSKTSSSESFVASVDPQYVVISAGEDNRYGHPHKEVMELLSKFSINIFETSKTGTIIFETDGENIKIK